MRGIPAAGVVIEFKRAIEEIRQDPARLAIWQLIISQYKPTFLDQCEQAIERSNSFVEKELTRIMFANARGAKRKAKEITKFLSDYKSNKGHDRHIHVDECKAHGLKIIQLEDDPKLQDLVLSVHHCYMHVFMNSAAFKIIENQFGRAIVKHAALPGAIQSALPIGEAQPN